MANSNSKAYAVKPVSKELFNELTSSGEEIVRRSSNINLRTRYVVTGPVWCSDAEEFEIDEGEYLLLEECGAGHFAAKKVSLCDVISFIESV